MPPFYKKPTNITMEKRKLEYAEKYETENLKSLCPRQKIDTP